jgi:hypothetical protein
VRLVLSSAGQEFCQGLWNPAKHVTKWRHMHGCSTAKGSPDVNWHTVRAESKQGEP